ncbi:ubiquinone biosynthesis accessory factor UbiK [Candidatus Nitrosacidococcus sp. I8]|uniref:ubiquinone biosynthesis accessory factor UbiK n=1 Tax=Candidatus Nitrosacidococcus sp. I8 TaxID=2942908 RepID=UPI00222689A4|nr:accessory factor UbiK family protein [Candidatus Nitrosacidococcus sp. I8]CAH9019224.1 Ubiquinone biosynthesis accessory factor UbiK [Candidatus Nitrosacidococcus sp. I8]
MIDGKILDDLAHKLSKVVPTGLQDIQKDIEKNFRAILSSAFSRLDLVTREEFDVQQAVLARTRIKLEVLEAQVAELEEKLGVGASSKTPTEKHE